MLCGCSSLSPDFNQVVAIEVSLPYGGNVELRDTLRPSARALNGRGDSVAATIYWRAIDTALVTVLDTTTGATLGKALGTGQIQARVGNLPSNPIPILVVAVPDTVFTTNVAKRDSVSVSAKVDSLSDTLNVEVADTNGGVITPVSGWKVAFQITYPTDTSAFTLVPGDTVLTGATVAAVRVKLKKRALPDSVVLSATARHIRGAMIPGSPITFTVIFAP
ncbi:MAG TPA: hypothetical protein VEO93_02490 [Gemmatimonadales bacterium]|nr:hypothetical protein [Gemmatimonadales bacterium]